MYALKDSEPNESEFPIKKHIIRKTDIVLRNRHGDTVRKTVPVYKRNKENLVALMRNEVRGRRLNSLGEWIK